MSFSSLAIQAMVKSGFDRIEDDILLFFHDPLVEEKSINTTQKALMNIETNTLDSIQEDYE